jgi:hypothetical protein
MLALPGIIGLIIFIYVRPQEFAPQLKDVPFLYLFLVVALLGVAIDVAMGRTRFLIAPQLPWVCFFVPWCLLTLAYRSFDTLLSSGVNIAVSGVLYLVIAHGIQTFSGFRRLVMVIFCCGLFVTVVCAHQGIAQTECFMVRMTDREKLGVPDHRPCFAGTRKTMEGPTAENPSGTVTIDGIEECEKGGWPGLFYMCEHAGLLGTKSITLRVRYIGVLMDPNELALATALIIPFAFSFFFQKKTQLRLILLVFTVVIVGIEIKFTQSRGGQVVFAAVLGSYFVKKYGIKRGVLIGAIVSVPMLLYGGRGGEEAHQSSMERLECAAAAFKMVISNPIMGVGHFQFLEHHNLTAHNAYLLAVAELGYVGFIPFCVILFLSAKIPYQLLRRTENDPARAMEASVAMAMLSAYAGIITGIFFLSWTYHYVLWIYFGLSGALYGSVQATDPSFKVRLRLIDFAGVVTFCFGLTILYCAYLFKKGVM